MSDEVLTCVDCGQLFIWTISEQRHYQSRNYSAPKRCPECRQRRYWDQAKGQDIPVRSQTLSNWPPPAAAPATPAAPSQAGSSPRRSVSPVTRVSTRSVRTGRPTRWADPVFRFAALTCGAALLVAVAMRLAAPALDILVCWLFGINVTTLFTYGYDKVVAGTGQTRVPENVLLTLTFAGGTAGALLGMNYFRHKTAKAEFQQKLWLALAAQVLVVIFWLAWLGPMLQRG